MKNLFFFMMIVILSSCSSSDSVDAGYKNLLIIQKINSSKILEKNKEAQNEFNKKSISRLPREFVKRLGSTCVENLHFVRYMQTATGAPIPSFTLKLIFINGQTKKYEFQEGEVTYRDFDFQSHELFGMRVDTLIDNLYTIIVESQCNFIKLNSNEIPHTITEDNIGM